MRHRSFWYSYTYEKLVQFTILGCTVYSVYVIRLMSVAPGNICHVYLALFQWVQQLKFIYSFLSRSLHHQMDESSFHQRGW